MGDKMKPALDNAEVASYELFTQMSKIDWHVRFLDKDNQPMQTNVIYISSTCYEISHYNSKKEYVNLIAPITAWGAKRIVNKFLAGKIPARRKPKTIKRYTVQAEHQ
jgi:hypothetical protein